MSGSERLAREHERILREIRLSLSTFNAATSGTARRRRKGVVYASVAITTGTIAFERARALGFTDLDAFKREVPDLYRKLVIVPNTRSAERFVRFLNTIWGQVINPAGFFASGWTQEHFMMLWEQVIRRYAKSVAFSRDCASVGRGKEILISLEAGKRLYDEEGHPLHPMVAAERVARAADQVSRLGFDATALYESYMKLKLKIDELKQRGIRLPA